jgi:hypothetical protein
MTPRDIFGIVVRLFGISLLFYAIWYLVYGIATVIGLPENEVGIMKMYFLTGFTQLFLGFYLLRGAPGLTNIAYPEKPDKPEEADD